MDNKKPEGENLNPYPGNLKQYKVIQDQKTEATLFAESFARTVNKFHPLPSSVEEKADPGKEMSAEEYFNSHIDQQEVYPGFTVRRMQLDAARHYANLLAMEAVREYAKAYDQHLETSINGLTPIAFAESYINKHLKG
jgi:hypothetical protein